MREDEVWITDPALIEKKSMEIIGRALEGMSFSHGEMAVAKRIIHTTGDTELSGMIHFSPGAADAGSEALKRGCTVVTDTNMALMGINRKKLSARGCRALCYMSCSAVVREAELRGVTRAMVSMEKAAALPGEKVYALGNAPTAIHTLAQLMGRGIERPALVCAVCVGFVNVVRAKEEMVELCDKLGVPCIALMGNKGGSAVAASVINALLAL